MPDLLEEQRKTETARIRLLLEREGREAALAWAQRTLDAYRDAIQNPQHFASSGEYRGLYEASVKALEEIVSQLRADRS